MIAKRRKRTCIQYTYMCCVYNTCEITEEYWGVLCLFRENRSKTIWHRRLLAEYGFVCIDESLIHFFKVPCNYCNNKSFNYQITHSTKFYYFTTVCRFGCLWNVHNHSYNTYKSYCIFTTLLLFAQQHSKLYYMIMDKRLCSVSVRRYTGILV